MAPSIRENWRVALLVVLLLGSVVALFVPGAAPIGGGSSSSNNMTVGNASHSSGGITNLQYGLQLSGGTRVRAPITGHTATKVPLPSGQSKRDKLGSRIAADLPNTTASDVRLRVYQDSSQDTVEVFTDVTESQFRSALSDVGLQVNGVVRRGVTAQTRSEVVSTLSDKVNSLGFSGAQVTVQTSASGEHYVVVEVPNANVTQVRNVVQGRGQVRVVADHPVNASAQTNDTVLTRSDIRRISDPQMQQGRPVVGLTLTDSGANKFASEMKRYGYTSPGGYSTNSHEACHYPNGTAGQQYCLLNVRDGKVVYSAGMSQGLAQSINTGDFQKTKKFVLETNSMGQARQVAIDLRAGALPAPLDLQHGTVYSINASLAQRFKPLSFLTGLIAALVVSFVVYLRYGRLKIALPMLATALSEVVILLGFSSLVGLALNLSHIAGFIAVIGTGVDDLVIIADEVTTQSVSSARVFQSRFRKAFWIIGGAAATTIIAMSPLAFLSLGDLRGFALVTILGVLIGVLITRPAYGDVLRYLLTDEK